MRRPILLLASLAMLLAPAAAQASYDPVGGGATTIALDPAFLKLLRSHGVKLESGEGARIRGRRVTFPVSGGKLDPVAARGVVEHEGKLEFVAGHRRLLLRALILKTTQAKSPLAAKFGGGQLKIADRSRLTTGRSGFGLKAKVSSMTLSSKVATRLAKKLRLHGVFHKGQPFGKAVTVAQPASTAIVAAGRATFAPSPGFLAKLNELFVSLNPISPAELAPGPVYTLPIIGGSLAPDGSSGTLTLGGSLEFLQLGGGQVFWIELIDDLGAHSTSAESEMLPSPPFPGKQGRVSILSSAPGTVTSEPARRTIAVSGQSLTLTEATAAAFDQAFGAPQGKPNAFSPGESVGTLSFTAQGQ